MNSEAIIQDTAAIERKLEELRSILETAKRLRINHVDGSTYRSCH